MSRVFLHSWHGDFARTQIVSEFEYLGRAVSDRDSRLRVFACGCERRHLLRVHRPLWMRVVLGFRLYWCRRCGARVLRLPAGPRRYYPAG